jgi:hypothetical protein
MMFQNSDEAPDIEMATAPWDGKPEKQVSAPSGWRFRKEIVANFWTKLLLISCKH